MDGMNSKQDGKDLTGVERVTALKMSMLARRNMKLNTAERKELPNSKFALPAQRKDPIPDKSHARAALTMGMRDASPAEKAEIRANVHKDFPSVGKTAKDDKKDTPMGKMVRGALSKK